MRLISQYLDYLGMPARATAAFPLCGASSVQAGDALRAPTLAPRGMAWRSRIVWSSNISLGLLKSCNCAVVANKLHGAAGLDGLVDQSYVAAG
jgi:hypothetical protein